MDREVVIAATKYKGRADGEAIQSGIDSGPVSRGFLPYVRTS